MSNYLAKFVRDRGKPLISKESAEKQVIEAIAAFEVDVKTEGVEAAHMEACIKDVVEHVMHGAVSFDLTDKDEPIVKVKLRNDEKPLSMKMPRLGAVRMSIKPEGKSVEFDDDAKAISTVAAASNKGDLIHAIIKPKDWPIVRSVAMLFLIR